MDENIVRLDFYPRSEKIAPERMELSRIGKRHVHLAHKIWPVIRHAHKCHYTGDMLFQFGMSAFFVKPLVITHRRLLILFSLLFALLQLIQYTGRDAFVYQIHGILPNKYRRFRLFAAFQFVPIPSFQAINLAIKVQRKCFRPFVHLLCQKLLQNFRQRTFGALLFVASRLINQRNNTNARTESRVVGALSPVV